jgi:hypothetical protein
MKAVLNPNDPFGIWWTKGEIAQADALIRAFSEAAVTHREKCPTCLSKQPCETLHRAIDGIEAEIREIGDVAFVRYMQAMETRYSHREYWTT